MTRGNIIGKEIYAGRFGLVFLFSVLVSFSSSSQNENDRWIFGGNVFPTAPASLSFISGSPVASSPSSPFYSLEPAATMSDYLSGNLLFYSDGITIYNKLHNAMPNGSGIMGCGSSTQGALIVRKPCNESLYYLFTVDCIENSLVNGLRYSVIDMTQSGGNGDVVAGSKNISIWGVKVVEKLTATKHANGRDYWIVAHEWDSNNFLSFLFDSTGINLSPVISAIGAVHSSGNASTFAGEGIGNMCISPDGSRLALVAGRGAMCVTEIFDFDNTTGVISNLISIPCNVEDYGVAISPDNSKLYTTTWKSFPLSGTLYQYDLSSGAASTINASETIISNGTSGQAFGSLQYGPDGKIYAARVLATSIGAINSPNSSGATCNYVHSAVSLSGRTCRGGLPNNVVHHLDPCLLTPLPVTIADFSADCYGNESVHLSWSTWSEQYNDYFIIERSPDGISFQEIARVEGHGNSSSLNHYEFYDQASSSPVAYYRLHQVDFNGNAEYSQVISITNCNTLNRPQFYFSASENKLIVSFSGDAVKNTVAQVFLINSMGQIVAEQSFSLSLEQSVYSIDLPPVSRGIYFARMVMPGISFSGKLFCF